MKHRWRLTVTAMVLALVSGGVYLLAQPKDEAQIQITVTVEGKGITVSVDPWRARLEKGGKKKLSWTCKVVRGTQSTEQEFTIKLPNRNSFRYLPSDYNANDEVEIAGLNPKSKELRDETSDIGQVFYYAISIPHPNGGARPILIDPEYSRDR